MPNMGMINTIIADPIKLFMKEDFVPDGADHFLHGLAPFLALFPVIITFAVAPMSDILHIGHYTIDLQPANLNVGALYILATIGIGVYGVALSGWASNNRWALLGGIRATAQMISYEIPLGLAIIAVVITYGSLDLQTICRGQGGVWFGFLPRWGILLQPVSFILLMVAGMAESKRVPFDLPEAESELVAGFHTEYSGFRWALYFLAEYANIFVVSGVAVTLFWGGWLRPFPSIGWLAIPFNFVFPVVLFAASAILTIPLIKRLVDPMQQKVLLLVVVLLFLLAALFAVPAVNVAIMGLFWFLFKVSILIYLMIWFRGTFPRFRYDQLMNIGWKIAIPVGMAAVLINAILGMTRQA
jgi:NADH-quinone oxidoreductase subunit H